MNETYVHELAIRLNKLIPYTILHRPSGVLNCDHFCSLIFVYGPQADNPETFIIRFYHDRMTVGYSETIIESFAAIEVRYYYDDPNFLKDVFFKLAGKQILREGVTYEEFEKEIIGKETTVS